MSDSPGERTYTDRVLEQITTAWAGHKNFAMWLTSRLQADTIVDLGVDFGYSTFCFALTGSGCVYAIDSFEGDEHAGFRNTLKQVLQTREQLGLWNVNIVPGYFDAVARTWKRAIDILHIDGNHTYEAVKRDYETWSKFVKRSGAVLFHDTCVANFGVRQLFDEIVLPKVNFFNSHGLGVVSRDKGLIEEIARSFASLIEPGSLQVGSSVDQMSGSCYGADIATKFRFVCATRESREQFFNDTALGRSLKIYKSPHIDIRLFDNNTAGLPFVYNQAIDEAAADPAVLIFTHDDVHLCDFHWHTHVGNALRVFEVVGLAGNKRRVPNQPAWNAIDDKPTLDTAENLSGIVGHGKGFPFDPENFNVFGPAGQEVKLLDGLMLISDSKTLVKHDLRFDTQFDFHFYDMDFCRNAEVKNVKMGTWAITAIHESYGTFGSERWRSEYQKYLAKWQS